MSFRYFVIGAGSIGQRHAKNLSLLGKNVALYSWRDIDLNLVMTDIAACNGNAGVVIATATGVRLPLIAKCAEAGAALYIEKPIAYRSSDVSEIFSLPEAILKRSVAGFMMRYHPLFNRLLDFKIDNIFRASFEIGHDVTKWRQNWTFKNSYAANPNGGGVLLDLCHEIDMAFLLCGPAQLTSVCSIEHPVFPAVDIATALEFAGPHGSNIRVAMDYLSPTLIRRGQIIGLKHSVDFNFAKNSYTCVTSANRIKKSLTQNRNAMFLDFMRDFVELAEGRSPKNPYIPRLDRVKDVCGIIAKAWEMREFKGQMRANLS